MKNVFRQIIDGEVPADKVFENDNVVAFKDINPLAPIHILIVPKKNISDIQSVHEEDLPIVMECVKIAQELALRFKINDGYRLLTNNGPPAGQTIFQLHFHLIGGKKLGSMA
jgi:histidine triad (HIT) family protein